MPKTKYLCQSFPMVLVFNISLVLDPAARQGNQMLGLMQNLPSKSRQILPDSGTMKIFVIWSCSVESVWRNKLLSGLTGNNNQWKLNVLNCLGDKQTRLDTLYTLLNQNKLKILKVSKHEIFSDL